MDAHDVWIDIWDPSLDERREGVEGTERMGTRRVEIGTGEPVVSS